MKTSFASAIVAFALASSVCNAQPAQAGSGTGLQIMVATVDGKNFSEAQAKMIRDRLVKNEQRCRSTPEHQSEHAVQSCMADAATISWQRGEFGPGVTVLTILPMP